MKEESGVVQRAGGHAQFPAKLKEKKGLKNHICCKMYFLIMFFLLSAAPIGVWQTANSSGVLSFPQEAAGLVAAWGWMSPRPDPVPSPMDTFLKEWLRSWEHLGLPWDPPQAPKVSHEVKVKIHFSSLELVAFNSQLGSP